MAISFEKVSHEYSPNTNFSFMALRDIDLTIKPGVMTAIIGPTGSGKTTLVQHLNALLLPSAGVLRINERIIEAHKKNKDLKALRKQVGLVFQFPEYQLFEETIEKDLAFGPLNFGKTVQEAQAIARQCLQLVNIDTGYLQRSPLDISGGQKRKIAIAGILAIEPDILVLDEPTAGLDPSGAKEMMELFTALNRRLNKTVIIVTHDFDNVITYCQEVVLLQEGKVAYHDTVASLFGSAERLRDFSIEPPALIRLQQQLMAKGMKFDKYYFSTKELLAFLEKKL